DSEAHELLYVPPMNNDPLRGWGLGASRRECEQLAPSPEPRHAKPFWRTLEERLGEPEFQQHLHREFPSLLPDAEQVTDPVARRTFLKLMGASLALAGVSACTRQPPEHIVPYVRQPEDLVLGR